MGSQSPDVPLALSASWQYDVLFATANRLAATFSRTMKSTETGCTKLKTTVIIAAQTLPFN